MSEHADPATLPAQPLLRRDAALLVGGEGDLRIALSARRVVTVVQAPAGLAEWLASLNGLRSLSQVLADAPLDEGQARALLAELDRAGLLADANHGVPFRHVADAQHDALRLAGRREAPGMTNQVHVAGSRRWIAPVSSALQVPGIAAGPATPGRCDLTLIVGDAFDPAGSAASGAAMARGVPHVSVQISAVDAALLPLTVPGCTACLRCWQLQRDHRAPDWAVWVLHGDVPDPPLLPNHHRALVLALIVEHTLDALAVLQRNASDPSTAAERYLDLRRGSVELRTIGTHPACGCDRRAA